VIVVVFPSFAGGRGKGWGREMDYRDIKYLIYKISAGIKNSMRESSAILLM